MQASDVRECLALRWPDTEYLSIPEAPEDPSRSGRKIDLLVISYWPSRGLERDAVEIKVSVSDWTRERKRASKADYWWRHAHRFWVAVPATIAEKVRETLPHGWGLLACEPDKPPKVIVKADRHDAEPLPWSTTVGVLRSASDAGVNALRRAEMRGRAEGEKIATARMERHSGDGATRAALADLREKVRKFEEASGLQIEHSYDQENIGQLVALIRNETWNPGFLLRSIVRNAESARDQAKRLIAEAEKVAAFGRKVAEAVRPVERDRTEEAA